MYIFRKAKNISQNPLEILKITNCRHNIPMQQHNIRFYAQWDNFLSTVKNEEKITLCAAFEVELQ
jgi:hypothetical protein